MKRGKGLLLCVCIILSQTLIGCGAETLCINEFKESSTSKAAVQEANGLPKTVVMPQEMILTINNISSKALDPKSIINPSDTKVTYHSSDESIAIVDENGIVTGLMDGDCIITATTSESDNFRQDYSLGSTAVAVRTAPKYISLPDLSIYVGNSCFVNVEIEPKDVTAGQSFTLTSGNENIVGFNEDGTIKGVGVGSTTLTASNELGQNAVCTVYVEEIPFNEQESDEPITEEESASDEATPIITNSADFTDIYSDLVAKEGSGKLGTFRCPEKGVSFDVLWGSKNKSIYQSQLFADSYGGIPGDIYRNTIIWDILYQFRNNLVNNLEIGDQVTFETDYGIFVYSYTGSQTALQKEDVNVNFPSNVKERYAIKDSISYDYVADSLNHLFGHSCGSISEYADGKLIICTGYGLPEISLAEFELVSGTKLLY